MVLGIRPEAVEVHAEPQSGSVAMAVQVVDAVPPDVVLSLVSGAVTLLAGIQPLPAGVRTGSAVHVRLPDAARRGLRPTAASGWTERTPFIVRGYRRGEPCRAPP